MSRKRPFTNHKCDCGRPSAKPLNEGRLNGPLANGCERCLRAETIGDGWLKPVGVPDDAVANLFPRGLIVAIDNACTRWLQARGLSAAVGHSYIERP